MLSASPEALKSFLESWLIQFHFRLKYIDLFVNVTKALWESVLNSSSKVLQVKVCCPAAVDQTHLFPFLRAMREL